MNAQNMAESFIIKYDGEALKNHTMDLQDLAPALLALSELIQEASKMVLGNDTKVNVYIKGNPEQGSVLFNLEVIKSLAKQVLDLFKSEEAGAFSNLITVLEAIGLIGGAGLIGFILKVKKNKKIKSIELKDNQANITFYGDNNTYIENLHVGQMILNNNSIYNINKIVKPLEQEGIDSFCCGTKDEHITILKQDLEYFKNSQPEEILNKNIIKQWVTIESLNFKEKNKWKVNHGSFASFVAIEDEEFLEKINKNEVLFGKNDMLHVEMEIEQYMFQNTLKNRYAIKKILEHKHINQLKIEV